MAGRSGVVASHCIRAADRTDVAKQFSGSATIYAGQSHAGQAVKQLFPLVIALALAARGDGGVIDFTPQRGRAVPPIKWVDETGRTRELSQFAGFPVVLLPIYSRCRGACVQNVDQLKKVLVDSSTDPRQFRILLFSFDSSDSPAALTKYRERQKIPLSWSIGTASPPDIDALLESIGFQAGKAGGEFMHSNMLLFLDAKLRVAKWIYGTDYSGRDVDLALKVASGGSDWISRYSEWMYALLLLAGSVLCVALCYYLMELRGLHRSHRNEGYDLFKGAPITESENATK
jgi:cytochrome oxidase Cu insertion factor (SCO1/SenC/PrrC family)